jgi:hypothetical protein
MHWQSWQIPKEERRDMGEKSMPTGKMAEAVSTDRISRSTPMEKMREAPSPKKVLQGSVVKTLKLPGLRKILHSLAFVKLVKVLRMIIGFVGMRAVPIVALVIGGWMLRRLRKR